MLRILSLLVLCWAASGQQIPISRTLNLCLVGGTPDAFALSSTAPLQDGTSLTLGQMRSQLSGFSVDTVASVFGQVLAAPTTIVYRTGINQALYDIRSGRCDVVVTSNPIIAKQDVCDNSCSLVPAAFQPVGDASYQPYLCCLDFSYTSYDGGWSFMVINNVQPQDYINIFFQQDVVHAICVCIIAMFFVAHLLWLVERRQFRKVPSMEECEYISVPYLDGLRDSVWFSTLCLLNGIVRSGKLVTTPWTRLLSSLWVFFGIIATCFITALISSTLTTTKVGGGLLLTAADMKGTTVCFQAGDEATFSNAFPGLGVQKVLLPSLNSCYDQLRQGKVDSVFGVREQHVAHLNTVKEDAWYVTPIVIQQAYALAWVEKWPYASVVNSALLTWKEGSATAVPSYSDSVNKFLAGRPVDIMFSDPETATAGQPKWRWGLLASTIALVALYMALQGLVMLGAWAARQHGSQSMSSQSSSYKIGSKSMGFLVQASRKLSAKVDVEPMDDMQPTVAALLTKQLVSNKSGFDSSTHHGSVNMQGGSDISSLRSEMVRLQDLLSKLAVEMSASGRGSSLSPHSSVLTTATATIHMVPSSPPAKPGVMGAAAVPAVQSQPHPAEQAGFSSDDSMGQQHSLYASQPPVASVPSYSPSAKAGTKHDGLMTMDEV